MAASSAASPPGTKGGPRWWAWSRGWHRCCPWRSQRDGRWTRRAGGLAAAALAPKRIGELVFPIAQSYVAAAVLVEDEAIARAQRTLWEMTRIVAEPGAAAPLAALLAKAYVPSKGERAGILVSGGNTTAVSFPA